MIEHNKVGIRKNPGTKLVNSKTGEIIYTPPQEEKEIITKIAEKYGQTVDFTNKKTYEAVGCKKCNNVGYYGRIGIFETLDVTDEIKELIVKGASTIEVRKKALEQNYRPLVVDGIRKILNGDTTLEELNRQLILY